MPHRLFDFPRQTSICAVLCAFYAALTSSSVVHAQEAATPPTNPLQVGGLVETYYQWNFGNPSNGITHARGFDNVHNSLTLSNASVWLNYDDKHLQSRLSLQIGATPSTYYLAETTRAGAALTNATSPDLWKFLQEAYVGYIVDFDDETTQSHQLMTQAGLFLSPIGPESISVKDNWQWSRSNLFFGLPFYHTGVRTRYYLDDNFAVTGAVYNGWNTVVDNNADKSISAQLSYQNTPPPPRAEDTPKDTTGSITGGVTSASLLYFGGNERGTGASEGNPWRHLFDAHATGFLAVDGTTVLQMQIHGNAGFEQNLFGISHWQAGAVAARVPLGDVFALSGRADFFIESAATSTDGNNTSNNTGTANNIFWPVPWVSSLTGTLDMQLHPQLLFRTEVRHDFAESNMFFAGDVIGDGFATPFAFNAAQQTTLTLGATAWF